MLTLDVFRHDGTPVNSENTTLFYDERIRIKLVSNYDCELHLNLTVAGHLPDRGREHSVVIYDGNLPSGRSWNEEVLIRHPRCPFLTPRLEISVTAKNFLRDPPKPLSAPTSEPFLTPFVPVAPPKAGFLVPFTYNASPSLINDHSSSLSSLTAPRNEHANATNVGNGSAPRFTIANRDSSPLATSNDDIEIVHWQSPLTPALELEIRSLRPALERDRVIAEITLACGAYAAQIDECRVCLDGGLASPMGCVSLPTALNRFERLAIGYNLQLRTSSAPTSFGSARRPLTIVLEYEMVLEASQSSPACRPKIGTEWTPIVDFEGTQGPLPKTPALHMNISSPMPAFPSTVANSHPETGSSTLDLVSSARAVPATSNLTLMGGITIMISGPQFVKVGEQFEWEIKVMNRSQRHRIFTMTFGNIAKDGHRLEPVNIPDRLAFMANYSPEQLRKRWAQQRRSALNGRGIIPLCHELKVGNLAPHVCFETKISLQALAPGTHTVEDAKIEDSASRDSYDVGSLLEVIVEPN